MPVTTPKQAEFNAAEWMRSVGYLDAVSPEHGADGGIDVRSTKALAQVKYRSSKAGRPEIQNLVGARGSDHTKALLFFDLQGYSPQAVEYANQMSVGLYTYDQSGKVSAVNDAGRRLMAVSPAAKLLTLVMSQRFRWTAAVVAGLLLGCFLIGAASSQIGWNR
ncbi:restriction endonuclease [Mycolicibacterium sp. PDY-3]|uniref:restriction endonuclease n=1 Tax=Mycolicibacterium sp. PDY-3 TaxID=3376069 RepID=UPI0037906DD7